MDYNDMQQDVYSGGDYDPNAAGLNHQVYTNGAAPPAAKTPGSQIAAWYKQYLGRDPENTDVVNAWSTQDAQTAQLGIENSPEAQAYRAAHAAPAAAAAPAAPALAQPNFGGSGGHAIERAQGENPALGQLRNLLMQKATQPEFADPNDPNVRAMTDAYSADVTRAGRSFLSKQAESGGPYQDMGAAYRSAGEKAGQATADYRANLLKGISDARRAQIGQALSGLGGTLGVDEATRLRQEDQDLARNQFGAGTAQQAFQDQYQTIFG